MTVPALPLLTTEFAHLVWLLIHRGTVVEEQKAALRRTMAALQLVGEEIRHSDLTDRVLEGANTSPPPAELPWLSELANRMASHSVRLLEITPRAKAAEILGVARALATEGVRGDQGAAFDSLLLALTPENVTVHFGRHGFVRRATPPVAMRAFSAPLARTPSNGSASSTPPGSPSQTPPAVDDITTTESTRMIRDAISRPTGNRKLDDLVIRLRGELGINAPVILDEAGRYAEERARQGKWLEVIDVLAKLMEREATVTNPDVKRCFGVQYRRLSSLNILKGLAALLPTERAHRDTLHAYFTRAGNAGADLLVDLLMSAESATERRAYRDAIRQCPAAAIPLTHQLRHPQWYVVRNAAELLGEMNQSDADAALVEALTHSDPRVRRAATLALIRLGTPKAVHTIVRSLTDEETSVRIKAVRGLGSIPHPRAVPALLSVLDSDKEEEVQHAALAALGRQGTPEAVARLTEEARPAGLLRRRKPLARRLAAITGLGEASAPGARSVLESLADDREREVRTLVESLLRVRPTLAAAAPARG